MTKYINAEIPEKEIIDLYNNHYKDAYDQTVHDIFNAVLRRIRKAPAADVAEVQHGVWENYPSHAYRRCSVCKLEYEKPKFNVRANFCPNCGAKMDGGNHDR